MKCALVAAKVGIAVVACNLPSSRPFSKLTPNTQIYHIFSAFNHSQLPSEEARKKIKVGSAFFSVLICVGACEGGVAWASSPFRLSPPLTRPVDLLLNLEEKHIYDLIKNCTVFNFAYITLYSVSIYASSKHLDLLAY